MNKEIEELLNMLKKCAREDKATLKLNEIACKTILSYIEQLENNRDKAIEFIKEIISSTKGVLNDYSYNKEHNKQLIELLKEDVEMYKNILNLLKGDSDE